MFFFKESIVYPFVQHVQVKGGITISNNEKCDIIKWDVFIVNIFLRLKNTYYLPGTCSNFFFIQSCSR